MRSVHCCVVAVLLTAGLTADGDTADAGVMEAAVVGDDTLDGVDASLCCVVMLV